MIINKKDKSVQTRSDASNFNWLESDDWYLVPDNSELAQKIQILFPRFDFVLDENGELIDIVETPKTEEEIKHERIEEIKSELNGLDSTINRATEDLYSLTNIMPYQTTIEVINKKEELRKELQTLTKVGE